MEYRYIILDLMVAIMFYGIIPLLFAVLRRRPIRESTYRIWCYVLNAGVKIGFILLGSTSETWGAYLLWTTVFTSFGAGILKKQDLLMENPVQRTQVYNPQQDRPIYCRECGQRLSSEGNYCSNCGARLEYSAAMPKRQYEEPVSRETYCQPQFSKKKEKHTARKIVLGIFLILVLAAAQYFGRFFYVDNQAAQENFLQAERMIFFKGEFKLLDSKLEDYVAAGALCEKGQYEEAQEKYQALGEYWDSQTRLKNCAIRSDIALVYDAIENKSFVLAWRYAENIDSSSLPEAKQALEDLKEATYKEALSRYDREDWTTAKEYFRYIENYKDSAKYVVLSGAHVGHVYSLEFSLDDLLEIIDFKDTKEVLVNGEWAIKFLRGTWKDRTGNYYFSLGPSGEDNQTSYNIPWLELENATYLFEDGVYTLKSATGETKKVFQFTVINEDTIDIYCYKDGSSYTMFRQ